MQLLRQAHQFEYRDHQGVDQLGTVDVWASGSGAQAVLVLRGIPHGDAEAQARKALLTLTYTCLPYLLRPDVRLHVLVLRPQLDEAAKARALVLPLSA
ncbi:hypothetical protein DEIPH_ctg025orf0134 [Deinococcus phoenicis]|uniref:Uncharacterized protein n=1 Tax=Deinococcus phoenicis TaxID=1476583 RepID=A0A016QQK6_9DEIO|nr:hypothetical protein [Deinococcus phoenicis]EYB68276.1 hypothetical protein DEIPH_ctg025orf0134 [Deinococcus phoenicis]